jgi:NAD(P)H dehydrogenase (quinone)
MPSQQPRLLVTGASGQLGRLVIDQLLATVPADRVVATVRDSGAGGRLAALGVQVCVADYARPDTLDLAFAGVDRLLLISSNALGQRAAQHSNVIDAARRAGVSLLAYTSVLHADTSLLGLAEEHRQTETFVRASGVPFVLLRNGWYTENYTAGIPVALAHHVLLGSAGDGRIASAARADYAAAAAAVLTAPEDRSGRVFELAGDDAYTLSELAAEIARQSSQPVEYRNLSKTDYKAALLNAGLPEALAGLLADSDAAAAKGALYDDGRQLSTLIGRATTPLPVSVAAALAQR